MQLHELILKTNSIHRTKLFYHKTLELEILNETADRISFRAGRSSLSFEATTEGKPFYHFAFNITNNRFSDSFEWISNKLDILPVSDKMLIAGYDNWNAQSFYFHDNNGSILEFIVRFDLPYYTTHPFSSRCIEEISEIGIVTDNVEAMVEQLAQENNVPLFAKGPKLPDFVVMGDDYGLLLICQQKRGWVPTNKPAQRFPITVVGEDNDRLSF